MLLADRIRNFPHITGRDSKNLLFSGFVPLARERVSSLALSISRKLRFSKRAARLYEWREANGSIYQSREVLNNGIVGCV